MKFTGERMIPEYNKDSLLYLEHMARYLFLPKLVKGKVVLDIASGSGYGSDIIKKAGAVKVIGVDVSKEAISYSGKLYPDIDFIQGRADKIPIDNNSIDVVVSFETIEHLDEKTQQIFLKEVKRVLKEEGLFVVSTPNVGTVDNENKFHKKEMNMSEFQRLLGQCFENIQLLYQDTLEISYISEKNSNDEIKLKNHEVSYLEKIKSEKSLFLIAVCSKDRVNLFNSVTVSTKKPWEREKLERRIFEEKMAKKDDWIKHLEQDVAFLNEEIKKMKKNKNAKNILNHIKRN